MSGPARWEPWDWYGICRKLSHGEGHFRPWEIERLTEPELLLALDDDTSKRRPPTGSTPFNSHEEILAYVEMWRTMTPEERLRRAMEDD